MAENACNSVICRAGSADSMPNDAARTSDVRCRPSGFGQARQIWSLPASMRKMLRPIRWTPPRLGLADRRAANPRRRRPRQSQLIDLLRRRLRTERSSRSSMTTCRSCSIRRWRNWASAALRSRWSRIRSWRVEREPIRRAHRLLGAATGREIAPVQRESLLHLHIDRSRCGRARQRFRPP